MWDEGDLKHMGHAGVKLENEVSTDAFHMKQPSFCTSHPSILEPRNVVRFTMWSDKTGSYELESQSPIIPAEELKCFLWSP